MPVEVMNETNRLQLRFVNEVVDGVERLMSRTISGVRPESMDADVLQAGVLLGSLQLKPLKHVMRTAAKELVQA